MRHKMQQNAVKRGFGKLLAKMDNLEKLGTPTLQAYRDALSAMQSMLASNPEPEELAYALADDFAKHSSDELRDSNSRAQFATPDRQTLLAARTF